MELRLDREGLRVLDEWRERCRSPEDARLVAEVLEAVADRNWQVRWSSYNDQSEPGITTIKPRDGLLVHVRLWTGEEQEFTIVSISDVDEPTED